MTSLINYLKILQPVLVIPTTIGVASACALLVVSDGLLRAAILGAGCLFAVGINGMLCRWAIHGGKGRRALNRQQFQDAADAYREGLEAARRFRDNDPRVAQLLDGLGQAERGLGHYAAAEAAARQALAVGERAWGADHWQTMAFAVSLGNIELDLARFDAAHVLYRRALAVIEERFGAQHPHVAICLNNLGKTFSDRERYAEAEPYYRRALDIMTARCKPTHLNVAVMSHNLGSILASQGNIEEANQLVERAVALCDPRTRQPLLQHAARATLGHVRLLQGRPTEAEELLRDAYSQQKRLLSRSHPQLVTTLHYLAQVFLAQGRIQDAEEVCHRELHLCEEHLEPEHPMLARALDNCAAIARQMGRDYEARTLLDRAQRIRSRLSDAVLPALSPEYDAKIAVQPETFHDNIRDNVP